MSTKEQNDVIEIKGEIGRIRNHLDIFKKTNEETTKTLNETSKSVNRIETALIGSHLNGNVGLVSDFADLQKIVEEQKEKLIVHRVYFAILGFIASTSFTGLIAICVKLFANN